MSKLSQLVEDLCPDGVEYKALGEVARIRNGRDYKHLEGGDIPVYGSGGVMTSVSTAAFDKPSVLIPRKGSLGNLFYVDTPFWNVDTIFHTDIVTELIEPKFLYYSLQAQDLASLNTAGGVPSLTQTVLNRVRIPVPPLPVQRAVMHILGSMDELVEELQTELKARTRQYTHYRDLLMSALAHSDVPKQQFGDVATIVRGASPRPIQAFLTDEGGGVNWIKIGDVPASGKYVTGTAQRITAQGALRSRRVQPGDFILSNSMSFGGSS